MAAPALSQAYLEAVSRVLLVNYYGEILTLEILSRLARDTKNAAYQRLLATHVPDEVRHAERTKALLLQRGVDPQRDGSPTEFTYHQLFTELGRGEPGAVLALLGENEALSAAHFGELLRIGRAQGDAGLVALYEEIRADELAHSRSIFQVLPKDDAAIAQARQRARQGLAACVNRHYATLLANYGGAPADTP
jgi:hypothetical protein